MIFWGILLKVNSYPTVRGFTAIGTGGDDFVQAMVVAVESVIQKPVPEVYMYIYYIFLILSANHFEFYDQQNDELL